MTDFDGAVVAFWLFALALVAVAWSAVGFAVLQFITRL